MCVGVTVGYTAAVEAALKRGNGKSRHSRQSPDRPVSSVTPTHASPSGPEREQGEGNTARPWTGRAEETRVSTSGRVKTKAVKGIWVSCGSAVFILGKLEGERIRDMAGRMSKKCSTLDAYRSAELHRPRQVS